MLKEPGLREPEPLSSLHLHEQVTGNPPLLPSLAAPSHASCHQLVDVQHTR